MLFALSIPLALAIVTAYPGRWYVSLYYPCVIFVLMLVDMGAMLPRRQLDVGVSAPARLYIGERGAASVRLRSPAWSGSVSVSAVASLEGEAEEPSPVSGILGDGSLDIELPVIPRRRGVVALPRVWLRWTGPLGMMEQRLSHACGLRLDVVPNIRGIHEEALNFFSNDSMIGLKSQRLRGEGAEFDNLCEFASGMDNRFIDWKRSARHRKLLAKEFRQERNHQIVLGFDTGHLMLEPIDGVPRLDHAIRAGLMLGWTSLHGGDLVGGCGFDARFRGFIQPGRGMPYFTQVQRFAAGLAYHAEETNFTLGLTELNARLKRRGLVVLFSEFVDVISAELLMESLQLLARRHLVIFVTMKDPMLRDMAERAPDTFHHAAESVLVADFLQERAVVLERVARMGVHCLDVSAGGVAGALLKRYVMIKQRGLL